MASDPLDVVTLAEIKDTTLVIDGNGPIAGMFITATSLKMDVIFGPIVQREAVDMLNGGERTVTLEHAPVAEFTTVTEYSGDVVTIVTEEQPGDVTGERFILAGDRLYRRSSGVDVCWAHGRRNVVVEYVAGRFADTASVDARYKAAASIMAKRMIRAETGVGNVTYGDDIPIQVRGATFAVPRAVIDLLKDQVRSEALIA